MKLFFIAGEASGDLHASNVIRAIQHQHPDVKLMGFGGSKMAKANVEIVRDLSHLSFMGFSEVLRHTKTIQQNFKIAKTAIREFQPDLLILVDYPGFNLRMAKWAKKHGLKVCFFIAPQVWAWKESRIHTIRKYVDLLIPILPFEDAYFKEKKIKTQYLGHPLAQIIKQYQSKHKRITNPSDTIVLFPGSREQEIHSMLPIMVQLYDHLPNMQFIIGGNAHIDPSIYQAHIEKRNIKLRIDSTYDILSQSNIAVTTSGTITLEAAIFNVPQIVCYKTSPISYAIGKKLIKVPYISLVNLIAKKEIVPELIQSQFTSSHLLETLKELKSRREEIIAEYVHIHKQLDLPDTLENIAEAIISMV